MMAAEFFKLAEERHVEVRKLLELDPNKLDPTNPEHRKLLVQKAEALELVRHPQAPKELQPFKRKLFRQLVREGLMGAGIIGAGAALGQGVKHFLMPARGKGRTFLTKYPALTGALATGALGAGVYAGLRRRQEQEGRIRRAHTVLR